LDQEYDMAFVHGKNTVVVLSGLSGPASGSHDLSAFVNTSTWTFGADQHDVTTYGKNDHVMAPGLKNGTFSMGGIYESTLPNNPWFVLQQANGNTCTINIKPEGSGTGKPSHTFSAVMGTYNETAPVADMVSWDATFATSDLVTTVLQ
jgi:hypothetical protein